MQDNVSDGSDTVHIGRKPQHVIGYLEDFLFSPERARTPVRFLSGGERNRVLLAKLFAKPANVIVLDEPTNDLDAETVELLEDRLVEYRGTLALDQSRPRVPEQRRHEHDCVRVCGSERVCRRLRRLAPPATGPGHGTGGAPARRIHRHQDTERCYGRGHNSSCVPAAAAKADVPGTAGTCRIARDNRTAGSGTAPSCTKRWRSPTSTNGRATRLPPTSRGSHNSKTSSPHPTRGGKHWTLDCRR